MLQCKLVMLAQAFDITHFEAAGFGGDDRAPNRGEKMVGKNIAIHERAAAPLSETRHAHDGVMEELTAGTKQFEGSHEVIVEALFWNVLGSADAGIAIEGFSGTELRENFPLRRDTCLPNRPRECACARLPPDGG